MGFFAVLAASLFAVFIFTVFGAIRCCSGVSSPCDGRSSALVLDRSGPWTFLKMDDKITALQKRVDELEAAQKSTEKLEK